MKEDALRKISAYLDKLLSGGKPVALDESAFDGDFRECVIKLNKLGDDIVATSEFAKSIAKGDIWCSPPGRTNYLSGALKELQSNMKHISWQADQVAKGNFNQSLDFMGDYTRAFNDMIANVSKREADLKQTIAEVEEEKRTLVLSHTLLSNVLHNISDIVIIVRDGETLFKNTAADRAERRTAEAHATEGVVGYMTALSRDRYHGSNDEYNDKAARRWYYIERKDFLWSDDNYADLYVASDITHHKRSEIRLKRDSEFDELTGIGNRKHGLRLLTEALVQKSNFPLSLCFIDLDKLKRINDEFGHSAGDEYLKGFASRVKKLLDRSKTVSRIGGDEFLIMMRRTDYALAVELITVIEKALLDDRSDCFPYPCAFSYGVLEIAEDDGTDAAALIKKADLLMYRNKLTKRRAE